MKRDLRLWKQHLSFLLRSVSMLNRRLNVKIWSRITRTHSSLAQISRTTLKFEDHNISQSLAPFSSKFEYSKLRNPKSFRKANKISGKKSTRTLVVYTCWLVEKLGAYTRIRIAFPIFQRFQKFSFQKKFDHNIGRGFWFKNDILLGIPRTKKTYSVCVGGLLVCSTVWKDLDFSLQY